jgi:hypothetical protein
MRDQAAGLRHAIACFSDARRFFTAWAAFADYAQTQKNLGNAYGGLSAGELRARAGAFIGLLWEVADSSANTYAQEFYRIALTGPTMGRSTSSKDGDSG